MPALSDLLKLPVLRRLCFLVTALCACAPQNRPAMGPPPGAMIDVEEKKFIAAPGIGGLDGFSHAVKVGKRLYLSGQVGVDSLGRAVGPELRAQAIQAFKNLAAILLAAGATPEDVVQLDLFVVGLKDGDVRLIQEAGSAFFPPGKAPAGSVTGIQSLPVQGLVIAINATAETRGLFPDREALRRYQR